MNKCGLGYFLWVFAIGFLWGFAIFVPSYSEKETLDKARELIAQCQKNLPRSQVCELTAKIKEGKE